MPETLFGGSKHSFPSCLFFGSDLALSSSSWAGQRVDLMEVFKPSAQPPSQELPRPGPSRACSSQPATGVGWGERGVTLEADTPFSKDCLTGCIRSGGRHPPIPPSPRGSMSSSSLNVLSPAREILQAGRAPHTSPHLPTESCKSVGLCPQDFSPRMTAEDSAKSAQIGPTLPRKPALWVFPEGPPCAHMHTSSYLDECESPERQTPGPWPHQAFPCRGVPEQTPWSARPAG